MESQRTSPENKWQKPLEYASVFSHISLIAIILHEAFVNYSHFFNLSYNKSKYPLFNFLQTFSLIILFTTILLIIIVGILSLYKNLSKKELPFIFNTIYVFLNSLKFRVPAMVVILIAIFTYGYCVVQNNIWDKRPWILETTWPNAPHQNVNMSLMREDLENFATEVRNATDGKVDIEVSNSEAQDPDVLFSRLKEGKNLQLIYSVQYYWPSKEDTIERAGDFFAAVPFGKEFEEMNDWIENYGGQELWDELCKKLNVKPFAFGNTGKQYGGWFKDSLNLRGDTLCVGRDIIHMRIPKLAGKVIERLHGTSIPLEGRLIKNEMDNNNYLNALEWVGPYEDVVLELPGSEKYKYYYREGWQEQNTMNCLYINNDYYNRLDEKTREIVKQIIARYNLKMTAKFALRNEWALAKIKSLSLKSTPKQSIKIVDSLPNNVKAKLFDSWITLMDAHAKNFTFKKIATSYLNHRNYWENKPGDIYKIDAQYDFARHVNF
jgi:TRAP-type mannitol/chloroaromatic compound transport system substrate-binding protein